MTDSWHGARRRESRKNLQRDRWEDTVGEIGAPRAVARILEAGRSSVPQATLAEPGRFIKVPGAVCCRFEGRSRAGRE